MKNTFKKLVLGILIPAALIMGSAAIAGAADTECTESEPAAKTQTRAQDYTLRDWQGYIAVFCGEGTAPEEITDIPTDTLNFVDRDKLREGIPAGSREELIGLLEDFSS